MIGVLDYQTSSIPQPGFRCPRVVFPILLTFAHVNLCWQISRLILPSVCADAARPDTAWTAAAWMPAAAIMHNFGFLAGVLVLLASSSCAGWVLYDYLRRRAAQLPEAAGTLAWRLWVLALLWGAWLPIHGDFSFVWQFRQWAVYG